MYNIIYNYVDIAHPNDAVLKQLIAVDYALQYKVKPKVLFTQELPKPALNKLIEKHQLPHHSFRFTAIPLQFNYAHFVATQQIVPATDMLIVQYNGISKPTIVDVQSVNA